MPQLTAALAANLFPRRTAIRARLVFVANLDLDLFRLRSVVGEYPARDLIAEIFVARVHHPRTKFSAMHTRHTRSVLRHGSTRFSTGRGTSTE